MEISKLTRNILIYSVVIVVIVALIILTIILFKVYKIKKTTKKRTLDILNQELVSEGHMKVIDRPDFGDPIIELREIVKSPLDDEIVEFTINTIIKNNFIKILMLGHKTPYEIIAISNKTNSEINILSNEFSVEEYNQIISKVSFNHKLNILEQINNDEEYDAILLLSSKNSYLPIYEKYIDNLKNKGMFLIANVTKNRVWKREIISKISKSNLNYDILKWYKGFILIVK